MSSQNAYRCDGDGCGRVVVSDSQWEQPRGWLQMRFRTLQGEVLERHFCEQCQLAVARGPAGKHWTAELAKV